MRLFYVAIVVFYFLSRSAWAEDQTLPNFTSSIKDLYILSEMCEGALVPSSSYYSDKIRIYMDSYYTKAEDFYWVLPKVTKRIDNKKYCKIWMDKYLLQYRTASADFKEYYPDLPTPPTLPKLADLVLQKDTGSLRKKRDGALPAIQEWGR